VVVSNSSLFRKTKVLEHLFAISVARKENNKMSIQVVRAVQEIRKEKVGGNDGKHDLRQQRKKETKWRKKGEQNTHLQSTHKATNGETKDEK
jgi:hypothetical protein